MYAASNFILCFGLVQGVSTIRKNMMQRQQLLCNLHDLNACDKDLRSLAVKTNYRKQKLVSVIYIVFFLYAPQSVYSEPLMRIARITSGVEHSPWQYFMHRTRHKRRFSWQFF